jgi:hypothetical protein
MPSQAPGPGIVRGVPPPGREPWNALHTGAPPGRTRTEPKGMTAVFSLATDAAPGRGNEDFVLATTDLAVVVDGAGPGDACSHGVPWFARQLAAQTMAALIAEPDLPLTDGLARGIHAVARLHIYSCNLKSPDIPRAAVGILRLGPESVDTLALARCTVVVDTDAGPQVTANRADGAAVAAADPRAVDGALSNSYPRTWVRRAAVLSDGASWLVDQAGSYAWPQYLDLLDKIGPAGVIGHVRSVERSDPEALHYPRAEAGDDASVAHTSAVRSLTTL